MDDGVFRTRDLSTAAALSLISGTDPTLEADRRGKVIFLFPGSEEINRLVVAYNDGSMVAPVVDFVERLKSLRSTMYNVREGIR